MPQFPMPPPDPHARAIRISSVLPQAVAEGWGVSRFAEAARIRTADAAALLAEAREDAAANVPNEIAEGYHRAGKKAAIEAEAMVEDLIEAVRAKTQAVAENPLECGPGALSEATKGVQALIEISRQLTGAAHLEQERLIRLKATANADANRQETPFRGVNGKRPLEFQTDAEDN